MVLYETRHKGTSHQLGTSGFLYRSNKLMYDQATSSLWSTLHGKPVIGPLVGQGIALERRSVVTTTWGDWKKRHPDTTTLSLNTGYRRDYGEGVAYQDYFATDRLMFRVPQSDKRLPNKREVVALRNREPDSAIAIDTEFLKKNPLYPTKVGSDEVIVITTRQGESRVYQTSGQIFETWDGWQSLRDKDGQKWSLAEDALRLENSKQTLPRYPSHQSFWFGWQAQYPKTRLIK